MEPVRIKYYGLVAMTKRAYLIATAVAAAVALLVIALAAAFQGLPPFRWPWEEPVVRGKGFVPWLHNNLYLVLGTLLLLELIDIVTVLRQFAKKEAEQRAQLAQRT